MASLGAFLQCKLEDVSSFCLIPSTFFSSHLGCQFWWGSLLPFPKNAAMTLYNIFYLPPWIHSTPWHPIGKGWLLFQRRQWHPTPVLLPGEFHGWRTLVGCSPWGRTESDMTEWLRFHFSLSCIGEGNGNPLQCSCLERIPGKAEPGGLPSMGSHRVGHDWSNLAADSSSSHLSRPLPRSLLGMW